MRVLVTRPQAEAVKRVTELARAGLDAHAVPLIAVSAVADPAPVRAAWARLGEFDAAMFVSSNAVEHFFALKPGNSRVFCAQSAIKTVAFVTGPGSYAALLRAHAEPAWVEAPPPNGGQFDSEALWAVVQPRVHVGSRVLIVRGTGDGVDVSPQGVGRDWFAQQVLAAGGQVEYVVVYQRSCPQWNAPTHALASGAATDGSVWIFSSSEAIGNLQKLCPHVSWSRARAVVTHPRIAQAARAAGFGVVCESGPTVDAMVGSIESLQ